MDLPRFVIMWRNPELDGMWTIMSIDGLMTYEQARAAMRQHKSKGYECFMAGLTFIAGPYTEMREHDAKRGSD